MIDFDILYKGFECLRLVPYLSTRTYYTKDELLIYRLLGEKDEFESYRSLKISLVRRMNSNFVNLANSEN